MGADLISHFAALGSKCVELDATERLRILHDFYRQGEESEFVFNAREMMKRGPQLQGLYLPGRDREKQRLSEAGRQILPGAVSQKTMPLILRITW